MVASEPQPGDVIAEKYRIDAPIGRGGMGVVLSATHMLTKRRLAVKWMLAELAGEPGAVERFLREARASARIDHPNVVRVYDVGQHEGSLFMVMELLEGEPLSAVLERGPLEPAGCVALMLPVIRGVGAAHAQGIIHRDIKPDNIFLTRDRHGELHEPKVLDFGISKLTEGVEPGSHTLTGTHTVLGTPYYMSKEQMTRSKGVDERTDVYALGVVLYQTLTGALPFDGDTYGALAVAIATETPRPVRELRPDVSPGLAAVVHKAMARELEDRYASVEELLAALEPFLGASASADPALAGSRSTHAPHTSTTSTPMATEARGGHVPATVPGRTRSGLVIAVGALLLALAAGVALWPAPDAREAAPAVAPAAAAAVTGDTAPAALEHEAAAQEATTPDAGVGSATARAHPEPAAKPAPAAVQPVAKPVVPTTPKHTAGAQPTARPTPRPSPSAKHAARPRTPATQRPAKEERAAAKAEQAPARAKPAATPKRKARAGDMSLDDFL